jgi:D-glycero-D-manno-heptose 1,7-bisphosphate phosphatase
VTRALFLDRDGTLMIDTGYTRDPALVQLIEGAPAVLRLARSLGYELILVSNQSGVGRGIISRVEFAAVQARLEELLGEQGIRLDAVYVCFHTPEDHCDCRKPASGLLRKASSARGIDLGASLMIGDRESDAAAGRAAGCKTIVLGQDVASWAGIPAHLVRSAA